MRERVFRVEAGGGAEVFERLSVTPHVNVDGAESVVGCGQIRLQLKGLSIGVDGLVILLGNRVLIACRHELFGSHWRSSVRVLRAGLPDHRREQCDHECKDNGASLHNMLLTYLVAPLMLNLLYSF